MTEDGSSLLKVKKHLPQPTEAAFVAQIELRRNANTSLKRCIVSRDNAKN